MSQGQTFCVHIQGPVNVVREMFVMLS